MPHPRMQLPPSGRLQYLPVTDEHVAAVLHLFNTDPDFLRLSTGGRQFQYSGDEVRQWIAEVTEARSQPGLPDERQAWLVVQRNGELTGIAEVGFVHPLDGIPWIGLLEIRADLRRLGFGREVATHLEQAVAALRGFHEAGLSVLRTNEAALAFWTRLGYQVVGERGEGAFRSHILHKHLAQPRQPPGPPAPTTL